MSKTSERGIQNRGKTNRIKGKFPKEIVNLVDKAVLFVGVGNELAGDDFAGIFLVKELSSRFPLPRWNFLIAGVAPENFLDRFSDAEIIVFVDACHFGGRIGEIRFINPKRLKGYGFTHNYSPTLIEYVSALGRKVMFLGIEPKNVGIGESLSTEVKKSIEEFIENLKECMNLR